MLSVSVLQLASRLEVLNRLRQEKAELAALKQDPLGTVVDSKSESLARLQALRQQQAPKAVAAGGGGSSSQQQQQEAAAADADVGGGGGPSGSGRAAAAAADGSNGAAAAAAAAGGGEEDAAAAAAAGSDGEEEEGAGGDPYAGMNPRQRKLYELKQKMQQARKANENAIIAERKRMRVSTRLVFFWGGGGAPGGRMKTRSLRSASASACGWVGPGGLCG
jgi:hypothetical protein